MGEQEHDSDDVLEVIPVENPLDRMLTDPEFNGSGDIDRMTSSDDSDENDDENDDDSGDEDEPERSGWRRKCVIGAVVFALFYLFVYLPWAKPTFAVLGSSMEPAYWGPRIELVCPECKRPFSVTLEATSVPDLGSFRKIGCPACGFAQVEADRGKLRAGEILRPKWDKKRMKRGDAVVFDWPEGEIGAEMKKSAQFSLPGTGKKSRLSTKNAVYGLKRVVGLPGETVEIVRGEIFVDGKPAFSTNERLEKIPIPDLRAILAADRVEFTRSKPVPFQPDEKRHNRGWRPHWTTLPIQNDPPFLRYERIDPKKLENVRNFTLKFDWDPEKVPEKERTPLKILANTGDFFTLAVFDWEKNSIKIYQIAAEDRSGSHQNALSGVQAADFGPSPLAETPFPDLFRKNVASEKKNGEKAPVLHVELRFFGLHPVILINKQAVWEGDETQNIASWKNGQNRPISTPFAILIPKNPARTESNAAPPAEALGEIGVFSPAVFRGLHYSQPQTERIFNVPDGEYLLLGDNSAVSLDGRDWAKPTIPAQSIRAVLAP